MEIRFGSPKLILNLMIFYVSNLVQMYFTFKLQICQRMKPMEFNMTMIY